MTFTKKQLHIIKAENKHKPLITILEGAVRSGKSYLNNILWNAHILEHNGQGVKFIMTGYTIASLKKNVLDDLRDMFGIDTHLNTNSEFTMYGNTVCCFGTDKADSYKTMRGMTAYGWYGNEVTLSHINSIDQAIKRCSGVSSRIFMDTNPDHPEHFIKTDYIDKSGDKLKSGRVRIQSHHFTLEDNTLLSETYIENIKASTPAGVWYKRDIQGEWVLAEGIIYSEFDKNFHVIPKMEIPEGWLKYRGIDWGFQNPFVCLWAAVDPDGTIIIYKEHYEAKKLIKDHAEVINNEGGEYESTVADHDAQDNEEIRQFGIYTKPAEKGVLMGIQRVAKRLVKQANGKARLYITENCVNVIQEFGRYEWASSVPGKNMKEEPLKANDHAMDAVRYIISEIDEGRTPRIRRL